MLLDLLSEILPTHLCETLFKTPILWSVVGGEASVVQMKQLDDIWRIESTHSRAEHAVFSFESVAEGQGSQQFQEFLAPSRPELTQNQASIAYLQELREAQLEFEKSKAELEVLLAWCCLPSAQNKMLVGWVFNMLQVKCEWKVKGRIWDRFSHGLIQEHQEQMIEMLHWLQKWPAFWTTCCLIYCQKWIRNDIFAKLFSRHLYYGQWWGRSISSPDETTGRHLKNRIYS